MDPRESIAEEEVDCLLSIPGGLCEEEYFRDTTKDIKEVIDITPEEVNFIESSKHDMKEFAKHFFNLTLHKNEEDIVRAILDPTLKNIQIVEPRQTGKSTSIAVACGVMMENDEPVWRDKNPTEPYKIGVFGPQLSQAQIDLTRLREYCARSPKAHGLINWNASNSTKLVWHNGAEMVAISASEQAETEGLSFNVIFCLPGTAIVHLEKNGAKTIKEVVDNKIKDRVLSFENGKPVYKDITGWYVYDGKDDMVSVKLDDGECFRVTEEHKVWTKNRGYVLARDLKEGDEIETDILNESQKQLVYGSLLGDMCARPEGRLTISHGCKQREYVSVKYGLLKSFVKTKPKTVPNGGYGEFLDKFTTLCLPKFKEIYNECYKNKIKTVTLNWLEKLNEEGLAYWYMDDGCCLTKTKKCLLSTHGFSRDEHEIIRYWFNKKWSININIEYEKRYDLFYISFNAENRDKFFDLVRPYIIPSMQYKMLEKVKSVKCSVCGEEVIKGRQYLSLHKTILCGDEACRVSSIKEYHRRYYAESCKH